MKLLCSVLIATAIGLGWTSPAAAQEEQKSLNQRLFKAVLANDSSTVVQLLDQGAKIDAKDDEGHTPLMLAATVDREHQQPDQPQLVLLLLLQRHADPALADQSGQTALHFAAMTGNRRASKLLLDFHAAVDPKDSIGLTPLMYCVVSKSLDLARDLLDHGADANAADVHGFTALMAASGGGILEMVKLLLEKGARVNAHSDSNVTALQLATDSHHDDVAQLLREHGAP
jgi:ankyrin repeat protein